MIVPDDVFSNRIVPLHKGVGRKGGVEGGVGGEGRVEGGVTDRDRVNLSEVSREIRVSVISVASIPTRSSINSSFDTEVIVWGGCSYKTDTACTY